MQCSALFFFVSVPVTKYQQISSVHFFYANCFFTSFFLFLFCSFLFICFVCFCGIFLVAVDKYTKSRLTQFLMLMWRGFIMLWRDKQGLAIRESMCITLCSVLRQYNNSLHDNNNNNNTTTATTTTIYKNTATKYVN